MSRFFGDRAFYKRTLSLAVPIMIQTGITNFVSMLDNIMVGRVGTEQMTGVSIANTLLFVFNLCIFGAVSGAGIYAAQFAGKNDHNGVRYAFRFKLIACAVICAAAFGIFLGFGSELISMYISSDNSSLDPALVLSSGRDYISVMLIGLIPFSIVQTYAGTLRETGETKLPMFAGLTAVFVNLFFNWVLIFGNLGAPRLGVAGAAIATVISRFVEMAIVIIFTHARPAKYPFIVGVYKSLCMPANIAVGILKRGLPLFFNEMLWSSGMAVLRQAYSTRGMTVVAALNISTTVSDLFNVVFLSMGTAIAVMVGQLLGADKIKEARSTAAKLAVFSVCLSLCVGTTMSIFAPFIPQIYNQGGEVQGIATKLIISSALMMPIQAFAHATYFIIRSGGKTVITFVLDSGFVWVVMLPVAWLLSRLTSLPIIPLFLLCQATDIIKCIIGALLVKYGNWAKNIVDSD